MLFVLEWKKEKRLIGAFFVIIAGNFACEMFS